MENTIKLKRSMVFRGGITALHQFRETTSIECSVESGFDSIGMQFFLDSKGGGVTKVDLHLEENDWPEILMMLANGFPTLAPALADATSVACKKLLENADR